MFEKSSENYNNSLLAPIHGISLQDYAAICYYLASGKDINEIVNQLGVDMSTWEEVNATWGKRMEEDTSFTLVSLFGQYYNSADQHKLGAV